MAYAFFILIWGLLGLGIYGLNHDLPAVVWIMGYGQLGALVAICIAISRGD